MCSMFRGKRARALKSEVRSDPGTVPAAVKSSLRHGAKANGIDNYVIGFIGLP